MKLKTKTNRFSKLLLSALPILLAAQASAAMIMFTGANIGSATTSSGTVTVSSTINAVISPATVTYSVTGLTLDDDGVANDSLMVVLGVTAQGLATAPASVSGRFGAAGVPNNNIHEGEILSFSISSIVPVLSSGSAFTTSYDFTSFVGRIFEGSETFDYTVNGGTVMTGGGAVSVPITLAGTADTVFTFGGTTGTGANGLLDVIAFDVSVNAVPEPSSAIMLGSVCLLGLLRRRR